MAEKYSCVFRIKKVTNKKAPIFIGALNVVAGGRLTLDLPSQFSWQNTADNIAYQGKFKCAKIKVPQNNQLTTLFIATKLEPKSKEHYSSHMK